jgi:hypothetical protein
MLCSALPSPSKLGLFVTFPAVSLDFAFHFVKSAFNLVLGARVSGSSDSLSLNNVMSRSCRSVLWHLVERSECRDKMINNFPDVTIRVETYGQ